MLKIDESLGHIDVPAERVVTLLQSVNSPVVNIPSFGTAPTLAFVVGAATDRGGYRVYVYLRQPENPAAITIYVSDPGELTAQQYRIEEMEAVRFLESMHFVMEDTSFRTLTAEAKERERRRVGVFAPPARSSIVDLVEAVEEIGGDGDPNAFTGASEIFGGLGRERREAFRRAGLLPSTAAPRADSRASTRAQVPVTPGDPSSDWGLGATEVGVPQHPPAAVPQVQEPSWVGQSHDLQPSQVSELHHSQVSQVAPAQQAAPNARERAAGSASSDADALSRLGRLLSTFAFLGALAIGAGCRTPAPDAAVDPVVQTKIDIGNQHMAQGQWPDAVAAFLEVVEELPDARDAVYGLGISYLSLAKLEEAERYLRQTVEIDPKYSDAKNTLATLLIRAQQCEEAETLLRAVLKDIFYSTPEYAEHNLARAFACQGRTKEAMGQLDKLLIRRPTFCLGYLTLAELAASEKMAEQTIKACEEFTLQCEEHEQLRKFVSPEHSCLCYLRKGLAYAQLGDIESARQSFLSCESTGAYGRECKRSLELLPP